MSLAPEAHVHFVGIGGAGLSAIARILIELGYHVSGSDQTASALTAALAEEGATIYIGHRAEQIEGADALVISSAVPPDNPEVIAARARKLPVFKRADFLGQMMAGRAVAVAVAGTHGKTTTTGMLATTLLLADLDPAFIVGGEIAHLNTNARAGAGPFVIEADEYDQTFLGLRPTMAIVTNVEHDHPDCYPTFEEFCDAFERFVGLLPDDGTLIVCAEDAEAQALGERRRTLGKPVLRYGLGTAEDDDSLDWRAVDIQPNGAGGSDYVALFRGESWGLMRLRVPGDHNVLNSLAVLAAATHLQVPFATIARALREFRGIKRRFEIKGVAQRVTIVDDYAHHPTEIRATLAAARDNYPEKGRELWAVWQPHTYSRTRALLADFARCFDQADHVLVTPIYAAREHNHWGIQHTDVVAQMVHQDARAVADFDEAVAALARGVQPGDVVLTLGAGNGDKIGEWLLTLLRERD